MKSNHLIIVIIVVLIVAGGSFFAGMKYQQSQTASRYGGGQGQFFQTGTNGQGGQRQGRFGGTGGRGFGGATVGEVVSVDANSITVKLQNGSSKIVDINSNTTYSKSDSASASDIKTGDRIAAFGATNSDGSITAQNVQLNPMMRAGGQGGQGTGQPIPTQ
jgi:Cu/Ag efflux protein CusF